MPGVARTINPDFLSDAAALSSILWSTLYRNSVPRIRKATIAAERLGCRRSRGYWELHIKEDERHGRWMLNDIALPLAEMYRGQAPEIVLGYDQQKFMSARAGKATAEAVKRADYEDRVVSSRTLASFGAAA